MKNYFRQCYVGFEEFELFMNYAQMLSSVIEESLWCARSLYCYLMSRTNESVSRIAGENRKEGKTANSYFMLISFVLKQFHEEALKLSLLAVIFGMSIALRPFPKKSTSEYLTIHSLPGSDSHHWSNLLGCFLSSSSRFYIRQLTTIAWSSKMTQFFSRLSFHSTIISRLKLCYYRLTGNFLSPAYS